MNRLTNNKFVSCLTIVAVVLAVVFFIRQEYEVEQSNRLQATSGTISTNQSGTLSNVILGGGIPFIDSSPDGVLLRDGNTPLLTARRNAKGHFVFSFPIRDDDGKLVAEISDNEWKLQSSTVYDRNYTDYLLEVKDVYGLIILQVADVGDAFYVAGKFRCQSGAAWFIAPDPHGGRPWEPWKSWERLRYIGERPAHPLNPLCRYPSDSHLGECSEAQTITQWKPGDPANRGYRISRGLDLCPVDPVATH